MGSGYVTVFESTDPIQCEMLTDVLVQEGVHARLMGTRNAAMLGIPRAIVPLRIQVPEEEVALAAQVIEGWENAEPLPDEPDDELDEEEEAAAKAPAGQPKAPEGRARLSPILAGGVALLFPGGAHMYARRGWTGLLLLGGFVAMVVALGSAHGEDVPILGISLLGVVVFDLTGGQFAVRAFNRGGSRLATWKQLGLGAGAVAVAMGIGILVGPHVPRRRRASPVSMPQEIDDGQGDRIRSLLPPAADPKFDPIVRDMVQPWAQPPPAGR